jgi:hypothetical protein
MCPTEGKLDGASGSPDAITGVAIDLQHTGESLEMLNRPVALAIGCIDVGHGRRRGSAPGAIVPCIGPELAGLGPASSGSEHRRRRLVGEQLAKGAGTRPPGRPSRPVWSGPVRCPAGHRSGLGDRAASGPRTSRRRRGRSALRSAAHLRSGAADLAPHRPPVLKYALRDVLYVQERPPVDYKTGRCSESTRVSRQRLQRVGLGVTLSGTEIGLATCFAQRGSQHRT